jgi:hypothetical protein
MKVHAIQTGFVRIKSAQVEGQAHGLEVKLTAMTEKRYLLSRCKNVVSGP